MADSLASAYVHQLMIMQCDSLCDRHGTAHVCLQNQQHQQTRLVAAYVRKGPICVFTTRR